MAVGLSDSDGGISSGGVITIAQFVAVAWDGLPIQRDSLFLHEFGRANSGTASATLIDTTASFPDYTGFKLRNTSDGSSGVIGSNTSTVITIDGSGMTGGINNNFDSGDNYEIIVNGLSVGDKIWYLQASDVGGVVSITVKGVPSITGASGTHVITYYLEDITDNSLSATYTLTVTVA